MASHEIVILVLSLGVLLAGLGWLVWAAISIRFPKGRRIELRTDGGNRVHIVLSEDVPKVNANLIAHASAEAVWASVQAWEKVLAEGRVDRDTSELDEVIIWFAPISHMEAVAKAWRFKTLSGYIGKATTRVFGLRHLPLATISPLVASEVMTDGEPVIHELMHALNRDYQGGTNHSNPNIWVAAGGNTSVQALARKAFATKHNP